MHRRHAVCIDRSKFIRYSLTCSLLAGRAAPSRAARLVALTLAGVVVRDRLESGGLPDIVYGISRGARCRCLLG
jgi:hypothetical protein